MDKLLKARSLGDEMPMRPLVPPPLQGLLAGGAMWLTDSLLPEARIVFLGQGWLAGGLAVAGLTLDLASLAGFLRAGTTVSPVAPDRSTSLVTSGFYRFTRNPMYLGLLLILIAWGVWLGNPVNLVWLCLFLAAITYLQIRPEEAALERRFGRAYLDYRSRVRRWL